VVAVFLTVFFFLATPVAQAKSTEESILSCGSQQYVISGFGGGTVFHVSGSNQNFVVTYARADSEPGQPVLFDTRGQQNKPDIVTCTTTSPVRRIDYTFKGFFTPRN
jgi:hypothetical protein